jgi:hypothetical protein
VILQGKPFFDAFADLSSAAKSRAGKLEAACAECQPENGKPKGYRQSPGQNPERLPAK